MSKFWGAVALLVLLAVVLLSAAERGPLFDRGQDGIQFSDLETECRQQSFSRIDVEDRRLVFSGTFNGHSPRAELGYSYTVSGDKITLDVRSSGGEVNQSYWDDCLASVVYSAESSRIPPGEYLVRVMHDGREARSTYLTLGP